MPLITQITRDGEPLTLTWGDFHVAAMVIAAALDSGKGPWAENTIHGIASQWEDKLTYPADPLPISFKDAWSICSYPVIAATPLNDGPYTLTKPHRFIDQRDGEVLDLLPGDILSAYRSF